MLQYAETPIQEIHDVVLKQAGVRLLIKREDLNHSLVSGNKWWKLKYNLMDASEKKLNTLITYGGAYSNHIFSTAAAAAELGFKSVGIIRGEKVLPLNPTLAFARKMGMMLHHIPRDAYRTKSASSILQKFENFYLIPEGGSNSLAVKGICEFARTLDISYEYLCCAVGTGGTLAGLIEGIPSEKRIIGFPTLKGADYLGDEIRKLSEISRHRTNWELAHNYHFGGYAKSTPDLEKFIERFKATHNIPLEFVYTGKMMAGIYHLISSGYFPRGATILAIHSGGIQIGR
ncbi:MAG TPA: pyridoxal-phosphate dependent enzyme [Chryseolinea sp.]